MNEGTAARAEVVVGVVGLAATRYAAGGVRPPDWELAWFRTVNRLPDSMYRPVWVVMQLGALGAAPATAAAALVLGRRRLATPLLVGGTGAWVAAKLMKVVAPRGRPALFLTEFHTRGRAATGGGFPSGHAGVATVLAATAAAAGTGSRALFAATAAVVGSARVYVGAHLPLDVIGGTALGLVVHGLLRLGEPSARDCPRHSLVAWRARRSTRAAGHPRASALPSRLPATTSVSQWAPR